MVLRWAGSDENRVLVPFDFSSSRQLNDDTLDAAIISILILLLQKVAPFGENQWKRLLSSGRCILLSASSHASSNIFVHFWHTSTSFLSFLCRLNLLFIQSCATRQMTTTCIPLITRCWDNEVTVDFFRLGSQDKLEFHGTDIDTDIPTLGCAYRVIL